MSQQMFPAGMRLQRVDGPQAAIIANGKTVRLSGYDVPRGGSTSMIEHFTNGDNRESETASVSQQMFPAGTRDFNE
ncbi:hypothetical protein [Nitrospira sp. M1]